MQNGVIERFNRSYREGMLDMYVFQALSEVRGRTDIWMQKYNKERPHGALNDLTPKEYLLLHQPETSSLGCAHQGWFTKLLYLGIQNASKKWTMPIQT